MQTGLKYFTDWIKDQLKHTDSESYNGLLEIKKRTCFFKRGKISLT